MTERKLSLRNPRTGEVDEQINCTSAASVIECANKLRNAQPSWLALTPEQRVSSLLVWAEQLDQSKEQLVDVVSRDTGRYYESVLEVDALIASIHRWCEEGPKELPQPQQQLTNIPFIKSENHYQPFSLVGVVSPWNFPLLLSLIDALPALLAGSSVLIKPSEVTPRFVPLLAKTIANTPELNAALDFVIGDGETGKQLIEQVDLICFTGSVKTGLKVSEQAAKLFIPAFLELGGKDAAIVCSDADLARAAKAICWGGMVNAGQSCMSIERVYVDEKVAERFTKLLMEQVEKLSLNSDEIKEGQIGPVIADYQAKIIRYHFNDAKQKGANFLTGGEVVNQKGGLWCLPTVVTNVDHDMKIMSEETFACVLPIMTFKNEQQAVEMANDSQFGLSGAVFTGDIEKAKSISRQLQSGAISINDAALTSLVHSAEKQSFKHSGLGGSRMGAASIQRFIRKQAYLINDGIDDPWWF